MVVNETPLLEKTLYTAGWFTVIASFVILIIVLLTAPAQAAIINPSVELEPWYCQNSITGWICDTGKQGPTGRPGQPGINGTNNFSAIYYNPENFTSTSINASFYNSTSFISNSNYTVFEGSINQTLDCINDSTCAYLPGRAGGQELIGGTGASDTLALKGSTSGGNVVVNPDGGTLTIGKNPSTAGYLISGNTSSTAYIKLQSGATQNSGYVFANASTSIGLLRVNRNGFGFYSYPSSTEIMRLTTDGNMVLIGMTTTNFTSSGLDVLQIRDRGLGAGTVMSDALGNLYVVSDAKAKTDVKPYTPVSALTKNDMLVPKTFKWAASSGLSPTDNNLGFIAQELQTAIPEAVSIKKLEKYEQRLVKKGTTTDEDEYETVAVPTGELEYTVSDRAIIANQALAIQELNAIRKDQQKQIDALNERLRQAGIK